MLLFVVVSVSLVWMHFSILYMEKRRSPELAGPQYLPEADIIGPVLPAKSAAGAAAQPVAAASNDTLGPGLAARR